MLCEMPRRAESVAAQSGKVGSAAEEARARRRPIPFYPFAPFSICTNTASNAELGTYTPSLAFGALSSYLESPS